jgi:hypothetical protein
MDQIKEEMRILVDDKLFPVKRLITNQKYSFDRNKYQFDSSNFLVENRLFTFLGKQMNHPEMGDLDKIQKNFDEFKNSVRWFSYRENIKDLKDSKNRKFNSDASKHFFEFVRVYTSCEEINDFIVNLKIYFIFNWSYHV